MAVRRGTEAPIVGTQIPALVSLQQSITPLIGALVGAVDDDIPELGSHGGRPVRLVLSTPFLRLDPSLRLEKSLNVVTAPFVMFAMSFFATHGMTARVQPND